MAEALTSQTSPTQDDRPTTPTFAKPDRPLQNPAKTPLESSRDLDESGRPGKRPRLDPPQLTAAAAFAEAVKPSTQPAPASTGVSPNPARQAIHSLMGEDQNAVSKAQTASPVRSPDPTTTISEPLTQVVESIQQNATTAPASSEAGVSNDTHGLQTSPTSLSSVGTLDSAAGATGITTTVGSPLPLEETAQRVVNAAEAGSTSPAEGTKAFSYPAPLLQPQGNDGARRGNSLPHSGTRQGTRSPSSKKHRCPYCATEFTRHHNLKSHLLTHSQEKPYVCSTCQSRFRRLHDLKRHTKLHTGERPHICPKCGRKFARGDALARHNKGPGGCAGRRASLDSFGGDDDEGLDDSMDGVMYNEPDVMDEDDGSERRPAIRRQAPSGDDSLDDPDHASRIPSTYPPIQGRPPAGMTGAFFPPRGGFHPSSAPSNAAMPPGGPGQYPPMTGATAGSRSASQAGPVFAQNPITESPKPLSPGQTQRSSVPGPSEAGLNHSRSPSMTHYHQQQQYNRGSGPVGSLGVPGAPQLPPPQGLNPPDARYTLPSQGGPAHPPTQPSGPPTHMGGSGPLSSHSNSLSSHGHGSGEGGSLMFPKDDRIWAYVTNLEGRLNSMQEEINSLKQQLSAATSNHQPRTG
ncbi:hypothetical protein B0A52_07930 [Exophiala mesophila]|uniref:C2H2-type domain-containing protein n=1 Tax=Exophiala mesophila TaxID=212818 RepID=A0A438MXP0_EXOME|nr:hypothetical protein B0A52_07930 [Exophiala mesophila]